MVSFRFGTCVMCARILHPGYESHFAPRSRMWPALRLESHRAGHIATGTTTTKNDDFLWLWKMRKHNILVHATPLHVTSNFFSFVRFLCIRSWLGKCLRILYVQFSALSTIGSIIVSECRLCTLLVSFSRCLAVRFFFASTRSFIHKVRFTIEICIVYRDLRTGCGFGRRKLLSVLEAVEKKRNKSLVRLPISVVRFWLFNIIIIMDASYLFVVQAISSSSSTHFTPRWIWSYAAHYLWQ